MAKSTQKKAIISIPRDALLAVLRELNTLVVSLDHLGSSEITVGREEADRLLLKFIDEWDVTRRLSSCRAILSEPFSRDLGPDDMDEPEREMQDVPYWSLGAQKPPKRRPSLRKYWSHE